MEASTIMADSMTPQQRHDCMSHIGSKDTKPELKVRRELFRRGYRYRLNVRRLPGSPDIVLAKYRTVIFVNGCFWHGHEGCRLYTTPQSNREFWEEKVRRNRERDALSNARLEALAWHVVTVWECELKADRFAATLERIEAELAAGRVQWDAYRQRRRESRDFAAAENRRRRAVRAEMESELRSDFSISARIVRLSRDSAD